MKSFLKNIFGKKKSNPQSISVIKYPDKILFGTHNQIKNSYWIRTPEVTLLNSNASNVEIGETIMKHLYLSKYGIREPSDEHRKENNEKYKKATGLKTLKAQMQNSLYVSISRENNKITFLPTMNGGTSGKDRGYRHFPDEGIVIDDTQDFNLIGLSFTQALEKCK